MRALGLVFAVLACGVALFLSLSRAPGEVRGSRAAPPAVRPTDDDDGRIARLEQRVDELSLALSALRDELARARDSRSSAAPAEAEPVRASPGESLERTPAWYLEQYAASFTGGGGGSEYFRLAVEAFAPSLLHELGALALDARAVPLLRVHLVQMLGDARFRGNGTALDACLRLLPARGVDAVVQAALVALVRIGDVDTARALEGVLWTIEAAPNRRKAVQTLVALAGTEANGALARLWARAPDDAERAFLISQVSPNEGTRSLELFEQASAAIQSVRLQAAQAVGRFRFEGFAAFIDAWSARETDADVLAELGAARKKLTEASSWSAERATGAPNAKSLADDPNAWASAEADMGMQWLELGYDPPLAVSSVRVFEVCVAGALTSIVGTDESGKTHELWTGIDPTASPGVFEVSFPATPFRVRSLRLGLDTNRRGGWSEIDAVELVGPQGRVWASTARASSSYGR